MIPDAIPSLRGLFVPALFPIAANHFVPLRLRDPNHLGDEP